MRNPAAPGILAPMRTREAPTHTCLTIAVARDVIPIQGLLRADDGSGRPFRGWLELVAAVEAARPTEADRKHPITSGPTGS
jgi:hypothetical protein